jgi:hypothetical protein
MRAGTHCALLSITAIATGCSTQLSAPPSVVLRAVDGPVWIRTEEIGRFRCEHGLLVCDDAVGRLSQRRCRCLE